jgi:ceramide glucosyltransferase
MHSIEVAVASLWHICTVLAVIGCAHALVSLVVLRHFARRLRVPTLCSVAPPAATPTVTILKPLYGAEPRLAENLASFMDQELGAHLQVLLGIQHAADPAGEVVGRLIAERPGRDIALVVDATPHGSNGKVGNLINLATLATGDVIVLADSDIEAPPGYLQAVLKALSAPGIGAVTCLYRGVAGNGLWSRLTARMIDWHFLPNVLVGLATGMATPCMGSTIALRRETLDRIGGFTAFADQLADDYEIGRAVRRLGLAIAVPPLLVGHACHDRTFADLWAHELRWARTVRLVDPWGYAGLVLTHPLPFALVALLLGGGALSLAVVALALACRLAIQIQVQRLTAGRLADHLLGPARDLLSFAVFVASFLPGRLTWRGNRFGVDKAGRMTGINSGPKD